MNKEAIQKIIDDAHANMHIPGLSVSIISKDDTEPTNFTSGMIAINSDKLVNQNSIFQIGSITKSFIACIVLQLVSEQKLSLTDPIGKYLKNIPLEWHNITVKQLLNHTSGIYNYTDVLKELVAIDYSSQELVDLVASKNLNFLPGTDWQYSNTNYILAGMLIEKVTGNTIDEELGSRIFTPLKLYNTYYLPSEPTAPIIDNMAHGYSECGSFPEEPLDITEMNFSWAGAADAILSTASDVAIYFKSLMEGKLLSDECMKYMMETVAAEKLPFLGKDAEYGLGLLHDTNTFKNEAWWHTGGTLGYESLMLWLPEQDMVITALINHVTPEREISVIANSIIQELL